MNNFIKKLIPLIISEIKEEKNIPMFLKILSENLYENFDSDYEPSDTESEDFNEIPEPTYKIIQDKEGFLSFDFD